jgi:hypothetical protein
VDNDGDLDIIVTNMTSSSITVFYNNGSGNFPIPRSFPTGENTQPYALFAADFCDPLSNLVDIAVVDYLGDSVIMMKNDGSGGFYRICSYSVGKSPVKIHGADICGDGDIDLVVANSQWGYDAASVLINDGTCGFTVTNYSNIGGRSDVYLKDINGDNRPDLVSVSANDISTALNNGNCGFDPAILQYAPIDGFMSIVAADVNADSDVDLVAASCTSNKIVVLRNKQICCHGTRGNVNWSADDFVDLSDLSALVSYIGGGYILECPEEADVNGDGSINYIDQIILASYLTGGGGILAPCGN